MQVKLIFAWKVLHLASVWQWEFKKLENEMEMEWKWPIEKGACPGFFRIPYVIPTLL